MDYTNDIPSPRVDFQTMSINLSQNCALPDPFLRSSHASFRGEHYRICPRLFFLQRRRGEQLLRSNGSLEVSFRDTEVTIGLLIRGTGDLPTFIQGALHSQP